jgi:hypothetical protein
VLRAGCNIALSFLMVITLLWGGCIACEQFFMFPGASSKCCNKSGQCERPNKSQPKAECNRMPLALQSGSHVELALPAVAFVMAAAAPRSVVRLRIAPAEIADEHSPPDLHVIHSVFLL